MTPPHQPLRPFPVIYAPKRLYRVARRSSPLGLRPWETVTEDSPLSGRFDDSYGEYRMLYTSATPEGALRETLQRFRPSADLKRLLDHVQCEPGEDPYAGIGVVPISWLTDRVLAVIETEQSPCVDLGESDALDVLNDHFQGLTLGHLLGEATIITRRVSRHIFNRREEYAGICMLSKFGKNIRNYAFFETAQYTDRLRARLRLLNAEDLTAEHGALVEVVNLMGLHFEGVLFAAEDPREGWCEQYAAAIEAVHGDIERVVQKTDAGLQMFALVCERFHVLIDLAPDNRRELRVTVSAANGIAAKVFDVAVSATQAARDTLPHLQAAHGADIVMVRDSVEVVAIDVKERKQ